MSKKIVLISAGQPSLNPRLVKEADALTEAGYRVTVIYAYWNDWGTTHDETLLPQKKWKAIRAGGHPVTARLPFVISRVIHKISRRFQKKAGTYNRFTDNAIARSSFYLKKEALKHRADLYIGHNLGALPATANAAKHHHALCGFDAEDFHRYEMTDDVNDYNFKIASQLEDRYFRDLDYLTTSSDQTAEGYHQIYPFLKPVVLLNVFPRSSITQVRAPQGETIRLVWFSQTIGPLRGLELVISALNTFAPGQFELHLLGNVDQAYQNELQKSLKSGTITFHKPVEADRLNDYLAHFDIGIASEPGFSTNNRFALSNKLFTYLQAGLAIVASDTEAQAGFMARYPAIGRVYDRNNVTSLATALHHYRSDPQALLSARQAALKLGLEKLNWETERDKFLALISDVLSKKGE